jgi:ABC-2 type transport system ATP-binding protein
VARSDAEGFRPVTCAGPEQPAVAGNAVVVVVDGLEKRYGTLTAVDGVSFDVREGCVHGLIGPNGAGKTTTLECLLGLRAPDAGSVRVFGLDPSRERRQLFELTGAFLQEDAGLQRRLRVHEAARLFASFYDHADDPEALLATMGLLDKRRAAYGDLSGGQKARLHLVLALLGRPRLLVLDEPTAGLDPLGRRDVWEIIRTLCDDRGLTVLVCTHHLDEAERYCNEVTMLHRGRVVLDGRPSELLRQYGFGTHLEFRGLRPPTDIVGAAHWSSERDDGLELVTDDLEVLERAHAWAVRAGQLAMVGSRPATLEDLFVASVEGSRS